MMNLSRALTNPRTLDRFTVFRRTAFTNQHGRDDLVVTAITPVFGVVAPAGDNKLQRDPDQQQMPNTYSVVTRFELQGPATGLQVDQIEWPIGSGDRYVINELNDCTQYGPGFTQAIITAITSTLAPS